VIKELLAARGTRDATVRVREDEVLIVFDRHHLSSSRRQACSRGRRFSVEGNQNNSIDGKLLSQMKYVRVSDFALSRTGHSVDRGEAAMSTLRRVTSSHALEGYLQAHASLASKDWGRAGRVLFSRSPSFRPSTRAARDYPCDGRQDVLPAVGSIRLRANRSIRRQVIQKHHRPQVGRCRQRRAHR